LAEKAVYYTDGGVSLSEIWKVDLGTQEKARLYYNDTPGFEIGHLALSPDKKWLAFDFTVFSGQHSTSSGLLRMRSDGQDLRTLIETDETDDLIGFPVWSPDGKQLVYGRMIYPPGGDPPSYSLYLLDLATGQIELLAEDGLPIEWSPSGSEILYARPSWESWHFEAIYLLSLTSGEQRSLWDAEEQVFGFPTWQPRREQVAVTATRRDTIRSEYPDAALFLVDVTNLERREVAKVDARNLQWSPDGEKLVYFTLLTDQPRPQPSRLWLLDVGSGATVQLLDGTAYPADLAWSADGAALLLLVGEPHEPQWISVMALSDHSLIRLAMPDTRNSSAIW